MSGSSDIGSHAGSGVATSTAFVGEPVSASARVGSLLIFGSTLGLTSALHGLLVGGILGDSLYEGRSVSSILFAGLLIAALAGFTAYQAARTGESFALRSVGTFGTVGSRVVCSFIAVLLLSWVIIEASWLVQFAGEHFDGAERLSGVLPVLAPIVLVGVPLLGFRGLTAVVSVGLVVAYVIGGLAVQQAGLPLQGEAVEGAQQVLISEMDEAGIFSWNQGVTLIVSMWLVDATATVSDITRYAKRPRSAAIAAFFAFAIGNTGLMLVAAWVADLQRTGDLPAIVLAAGAPLLAFALLLALTTTTSVWRAYSATISLAHVVGRQFRPVLGVVAVGCGLLSVPFMLRHQHQWLGLLLNVSFFVAPLAGAICARGLLAARPRSLDLWLSVAVGALVCVVDPLSVGPVLAFVATFFLLVSFSALLPVRAGSGGSAALVLRIGVLGGVLSAGLAFVLDAEDPLPAEARPALIAFSSTGDDGSEIYLGDDQGVVHGCLTDDVDTDAAEPVWSPDGSRIAFVVTRRDTGRTDIFVMDADGRNKRNLTDHRANDEEPTWSPDGAQIAFTSRRDPVCGHAVASCEDDLGHIIYIMDSDGENVRRLTDRRYPSWHASWSPDGRAIVFASTQHGPENLYSIAPDGTGQKRLTGAEEGDGDPAWSPDGKLIAFSSNRGTYPQIWTMRPDGRDQTQLTFGPMSGAIAKFNPEWSPSGGRVSYETYQGFARDETRTDIYIAHANGTGAARLTRARFGGMYLSWFPGAADAAQSVLRRFRERSGPPGQR